MINLRYISPCALQGEIHLNEYPRRLGFVTDVEGTEWDINGIIGEYVQACRKSELHSYYTDTSGAAYGFVSQTWKPYRIVIEDKQT